MSILRVVKRGPTAINVLVDYNPSAFRYYIDTIEVMKESVRDGLKSAFCGMLDELLRPDENNGLIDGNWSFTDRVVSTAVIGGTTTTVNNYTGIKYLYRQATNTQLTALIPATLGTYTGRTFKTAFNPMTMGTMYVETNNLDEVTHGESNATGMGIQYLSISNLGGTPRIPATFQTTNAGYGAVQQGEQGTHGKDEFNDFQPLSFWNQTTDTGSIENNNEYYGKFVESVTGFTIDSSKIMFAVRSNGETLARYSPFDVVTFTSLIALHFNYRTDKPVELEL